MPYLQLQGSLLKQRPRLRPLLLRHNEAASGQLGTTGGLKPRGGAHFHSQRPGTSRSRQGGQQAPPSAQGLRLCQLQLQRAWGLLLQRSQMVPHLVVMGV